MTATPAPGAALTHRQILTVFAGIMAGMAVAALDQTIVTTALPTIVGDLGGLDHYSWVVTAYLLTSTSVMPIVGKLSDIHGRKPMFQLAIATFTVGSLLCGLAQSMNQLIAFRAVQGIGAGGLLVLAFAIIGDVVPPRERGRYQGLVASVFAVSSVIGPFIGGAIVDHLNWHWVFLVNLPVGIAALVVTQRALRLPFRRQPQRIDWLGACLLVSGVVCLLLVTVWGGGQYAWDSAAIIGLGAAAVVLLGLFVWESLCSRDPVIPLRLFSIDVFTVTSSVAVFLGMAMFGVIVFLPVYLQIVQGRTATNSGLLMLPVMAGILTASTLSGRLVTRLGNYRPFPIIGSGMMTLGFVLFATMDASTPMPLVWGYMLLTGLGVGMVMPMLVLAVQNAVSWSDLGAATSATTFFRQMGAAFGTAVLGAVMSERLTALLPGVLPAGSKVDTAELLGTPEAIRTLPADVQAGLVSVFQQALHTVFLVAVPIAGLAFLISWFLPARELKQTSFAEDGAPVPGDAAAAAAV